MARDQELIDDIPQDDWVELTNDDVAVITFQVFNGSVMIRGTVGATPPTGTHGFHYEEGEGPLNTPVNTLFKAPGINRIWARSLEFQSSVMVDHA